MSSRILFSLLIATALAGCADPPGLATPKPLDLQEEARSTALFQKYGPHLRQVEGVLNTYLTASNNPRVIMVVVKDEATADAVAMQYATLMKQDGIPLKTKVAERDVPEGGPIEAVPVETVPDTWWGKVVLFLRGFNLPWRPKQD